MDPDREPTAADPATQARAGGIATVDPTSGETLEVFEPHSETEIEERLRRAEAAFRIARRTPVDERARWLVTVADLIEGELPGIAHMITTEMGKTFAGAKGEVAKCARVFRWYAEHGPRLLQDELPAGSADPPGGTSCGVGARAGTGVLAGVGADRVGGGISVRYQPLGAVLAVMPWNFPFFQVTRFAAPALLAGNVAVLKHAANVPRSSLFLHHLFERAGCPPGVFQSLLVGSGRVKGLIEDPRIVAVSLTGSEQAGRAVAGAAGAALKKSVLELGGSDPFIVLPTADVARAAEVAVMARVQNNGQSCIAAKRFIVHDAVAEEFTERFVAGMAALSVGDPMLPATEVGPLATADGLSVIDGQVEDARSQGAAVVCGGHRVEGPHGSDRPGFFYAPTVITGITEVMRVAREEVFGPVALLFRVPDADGALAMANDTAFGLGASVWTDDAGEQERFIADLECGQVFVNDMVASQPELPFGGVKASGYGRELSVHGLREFCNVKAVKVA